MKELFFEAINYSIQTTGQKTDLYKITFAHFSIQIQQNLNR